MVSVGFPQKSNFGVLTAAEVRTPIIDNPAGTLYLRSAGVQGIALSATTLALSQNLNLPSATHSIQSGGIDMIGHDALGNINVLAPITHALGVRTPLVNNPAGDLQIERAGALKMSVQAAAVAFSTHAKLLTDMELRDNGNNVIIAGDNVGNIDQLARIDDAVKAPVTSHYILSSVGTLTTPVQSGTIDEIKGYWHTDADDILYLFLGQMFGRLALGGQVHIDSIKVAYKTEHNDAYVDFARLYRDSLIGVSTVLVGDNSVNNGDGNTDQAVLTVSVDAAVVANYQYKMEIKAEATAGIVRIYGIEVTYHTT